MHTAAKFYFLFINWIWIFATLKQIFQIPKLVFWQVFFYKMLAFATVCHISNTIFVNSTQFVLRLLCLIFFLLHSLLYMSADLGYLSRLLALHTPNDDSSHSTHDISRCHCCVAQMQVGSPLTCLCSNCEASSSIFLNHVETLRAHSQ